MLWAAALACALLAVASRGGTDSGGTPASFYPRFNPFFFLCAHHGEPEGPAGAEGGGEVLLTFQINGNPSAYIPGQEYQGESLISPLSISLLCSMRSYAMAYLQSTLLRHAGVSLF